MNFPVTLTEMDLQPVMPIAKLARLPQAEFSKLIAQMVAMPDDACRFMSQFQLFSVTGSLEFALEMQTHALELATLYRIEGSNKSAIRLLALMGAGYQSANTPLDYLLEDSDIRLDLLYIVPGHPLPAVIPDHDVAIVALGESDQNQPVLELMEALIENWPRPVLNPAKYVRRCSRDGVYRLLKDIPGLLIPPTLRFTRHDLEKIARNEQPEHELPGQGAYPVTVRPLVSQGGSGLAKIADAAQLAAYLEGSSEQAFFVSYFVDYQSPDGYYRKARIALIAGRPYICHLAISDHWIVHYGTAGMTESSAKREEEARFMREFDSGFVGRHGEALRLIAETLALDYVVIDCAEAQDGKLLLFEADNRSWVHATDPVDVFPYKQHAMQRVFSAFRSMLLKAMKQSFGGGHG